MACGPSERDGVNTSDSISIAGVTRTEDGIFQLPICMPDVEVALGDMLASITFETVEGDKVEIPVGHQALSNLYQLLGKAPEELGPNGGPIQ